MALPSIFDNHTGDHGASTAASGAATDHHVSGQVTTESLTTAAGGGYLLTLTNQYVKVDSVVFASVFNGSNTTNYPDIVTVTPAAGSVGIIVRNIHASAAFNGTIVISFVVL